MVWKNPITQKLDSVACMIQIDLSIQSQPQSAIEKQLNMFAEPFQIRPVSMEDNEIIHVTNIAFNPQVIFQVMIQQSQVIIGKMLAGEISNGDPLSRSCLI